jgi:cytochrome c556
MNLMKLSLVLLFAVGAVFAAAPQNQDEQEHPGWMKTAQATAGSLRKNIEAKATDEIVKNAATMEEVFKKCEDFWTKRKTDDAIKWSQQSQAAAKEIGEAAKGGDMDKAQASLKSLMSNCAGCHNAHRERLPDGSYKIK